MTGEPEYESIDYVGSKEQAAYLANGGAMANMTMMSPVPGATVVGYAQRMQAQDRASELALEYGHNQAQQLARNHRLWDKPPEIGGTHYLSYEHRELKRFVNEKFDPTSVHEAGRYYNKVGGDLIEFSGRIRDAAMKTEQSWQGRAGDAMRGKMTSLSDHMGHSGEAAQLTGNQLGLQAEAAERARNAMPEPVDVDVRSEMQRINGIEDPVRQQQQADELRRKIEDSRAKHQEAARVVADMENDFGSAATKTPKFAPPPPPPAEDGGGTAMPGGGSGVGSFSSPSSAGSGTAATTSSAAAGPALGSASTGGTAGTGGVSGASSGPASSSSSWASSGGNLPPGVQRGPDGTLWRQGPNGEWQRQNPYNGRWAPAPHGPGGPSAGRGGAGRGSVGGGGGGRAGGSVGGRAGGGYGPRGGTPPTAGGQSGGRVAGAPGSTTPGTAASSSSARGGRGPVGGMAGRGQNGDEGDEHDRKYVLETDEAWDELGIERVAPPVLGALPDEEGGGR